MSSEGISSTATCMLCELSEPSKVIVQVPSITSFITPMYYFVVPSSSSSIPTLTRRFSKSGRSLSLSPTGQQKSKRKHR